MLKRFEKANKISSIIGILGLFNLPVIKYSVDWWNTLHQPSSITLTSAPTIHYTMLGSFNNYVFWNDNLFIDYFFNEIQNRNNEI